MAIEASAARNEAEQQYTAHSSRSLRSHQLQYVPNTAKKRTFAMKFGNSDEKKEEKTAESKSAAKKPKKADGKHVSTRAATSGNELD